MNEVYVIAGGEWLRNNLNAIAAFMGTRTWDSIEKIALTLSVVAVAFMWVQRHNVMDLLGWAAVFVLISLLVNIRTSVQIIDNSDLVKVHRADNVPVGLAMPLSLTTRIGHAMVASYEMIYTQPDSFTYSKTGMLFGAELVSKSTDFLSRNPEIANLFQDYVQNCVMGDIYLNHKYTLEELMASSDPYTLIFSRPSPLRGVYDSNNNFVTCKDASVSLKDKLNLDTQSGGKTWHYYAQQLFGGRPDPNLLPVGINATRQIAAAQQEMAREASNRAESALHGFSSSIASAWNSLSQFGSNRGSSDSVTGGADSTMSAQDSMMASRMRSAVESYAKAHNISNEQATRELASRSTRGSAGMYGDAHAEWGVKPKILGVGGGVGVRGGGRASIDWSDEDAHQASSGSRASHDARHDIDARATQDFKEASDYFTSRKVSESGSHTDNNADSRVDQLSAALNSAKQSYDQYTTNMTRSHEYAEMASRTESMSGQMSEDLSQQFAQYVMKHAPQDAEAILTNTSSPEIAERRRAMAWSFVQEQVQPGVDNAWRESRGDIGKGMESVPSGGGSQDIIADHQGHQAIIEQRTQDSNIRNDVKHQVDNMVTEYRGNIGDTQSSIRGEENIVGRQYSELQNHHKTEALSQNNKYNEEKSGQERMPGADSPQELMKRAKEYQDKHKQ